MTDGKTIMDRMTALKNKSESEILSDATRGTFTATCIGGALGLYIGYSRKYNMLLTTFIGGAVAGIAAKYFINR